jgi:hypothetical protein
MEYRRPSPGATAMSTQGVGRTPVHACLRVSNFPSLLEGCEVAGIRERSSAKVMEAATGHLTDQDFRHTGSIPPDYARTTGRTSPERVGAQTKMQAPDRPRAFFGQLIHAFQLGKAIRCRVASLGSQGRVPCCTYRPVTDPPSKGRHRLTAPLSHRSRGSIARRR